MSGKRVFPAYDLKGGDVVGGREVFDVVGQLGPGGRVAVKFCDGSRLSLPSWDSLVEID